MNKNLIIAVLAVMVITLIICMFVPKVTYDNARFTETKEYYKINGFNYTVVKDNKSGVLYIVNNYNGALSPLYE